MYLCIIIVAAFIVGGNTWEFPFDIFSGVFKVQLLGHCFPFHAMIGVLTNYCTCTGEELIELFDELVAIRTAFNAVDAFICGAGFDHGHIFGFVCGGRHA